MPVNCLRAITAASSAPALAAEWEKSAKRRSLSSGPE
ncbi:Uncharacterised protein [Mycobacteroides abscessus subsp. abscessus]|nr:Uncharacterised protein [Mycobacteroides abscessus subsp. abscessus]